jgi:Zn-dependent protease
VLRFRIGPFPVTVHVSFLFAAALLGWYGTRGIGDLLVWIGVVFVSVLFHEMGHAVVGRVLGGRPEIQLEGFGGVTFPRLPAPPGPARQLLLSVAGPIAGLALGAIAFVLSVVLPPDPGSPTARVLDLFKLTSVVWAVLNLLPVLPLDGGQMLLAVLEGIRRKPSLRLASWISAVLAIGAAAGAYFFFSDLFVAVWFALFAMQNVARARLTGQPAPPPSAPAPQTPGAVHPQERVDVERELARARSALVARDEEAALAAAAALEEGDGPYRQAAGLRIRAGVELARGDFTAAGLHAGRSFTLWQSPDAAVVAARANLRAGERERAQNWLRRALEAGAAPAAVRADSELGPLAG